MNEKAGFFVNNKGLGQYNRINFNNFDDTHIGFFKDGIQLNNNLFGIFDPELISINEINIIELCSNTSSFIYGMNSNGKAVNIITKDTFAPKPFSQLRYSQDRYGSLFADASFTIPFSKKLNFLIRANNHSLDGRYTNSDFSVWRADGRISWFPSSLWNFKLDFNYSKISRGLNNGLVFLNKDLSNDSIIANLKDSKAEVVDPTGREENRNYNTSLSLYSKSFGENSLTTMQLYYMHYYRAFSGRDIMNFFSPIYHVDDYYYTERLGLNLKYNKKIISTDKNSLDVSFINNYYFNNYDLNYIAEGLKGQRDTSNLNSNFGFISGKVDYRVNNISVSGMAKEEFSFGTNSNTAFSYGGEAKYKLINNNSYNLNIFAGANHINYLEVYTWPYNIDSPMFQKYTYRSYETGLSFSTENFKSKLSYNKAGFFSWGKLNFTAGISKFTLESENNFKLNYYAGSIPFFSKNDISFADKLFKDKLNLKIGVYFKFISNFESYTRLYGESVIERFYIRTSYNDLTESLYAPNNKFIADFYIGARIGHANVNFTVANIFNSFYFDTFMFPADDRGGLGGAVSRFTIVWDFIN